MAALRQDLSYTFRRLVRSPGLVITVVLSIAIGIAANATIFSMVSRFVLRPAPVGDPATLLALHTTHDGEQCCNNFPQPVYEDVRDQAKSFSGVAAYDDLLPASIGGTGEPERVWGQAATANFFNVAQLTMTLGRGFNTEEERLPVIVLSHQLWRTRFNADPAIAGKAIILSGHPYTVVGVAPAEFRGVDLILNPQFWVPLGDLPQLTPNPPSTTRRTTHWLSVIGRLKPGVTRNQAAAELHLLAQHLATAHPASDKGNGFFSEQAGSLPPRDRSPIILFLSALSVVVLLVLCIACANVANLLLAQSASRQRETGIRIALGATRPRLLRQMLLESILLALAGGCVGVVLSLWTTSALSSFHLPAPIPLDLSIGLDWRVLLYAFALSVGTGLLFGFVPAWIASHPNLMNALKGEDALARPERRWSLRNILVVAQIAISVILLYATGLFLRSLQSAASIDTGFRSIGVLMVAIDPSVHGYTPERTTQLLALLRDRIATLPSVTSVAYADLIPLSGGGRSDGMIAEGRPASQTGADITELYMVSPGYFDTMGIPRVAGDDFTTESPTAPKVAIVNQEFAHRLFAHDNPIGQTVKGGGVTYRIIGVVANIKSRTLGEATRPVLYRSLNQNIAGDPSFNGYSLIVRSDTDPANLTAGVRREIASLDPSLAIFNIQTMREHLHDALFLPRLAGTLFGIFGGIGLLLAAIGLYGVMSYSVSRRTQEIGIRMALGAQIGAVQRMIVTQGMWLAIIAVALGLPIAFALARLSTSFLYGVRPHDLATFTAVPLFLVLITLTACWIPSRRASRIDPIKALRCDG